MNRLTAIVLGAAAGGGYPQWNCCCDGCRLAWAGDLRAPPRTQASLAVSATGRHWALLNASPDLRQQIGATRVLHPQGGLRVSPIESVILTGAEIDQIAGLLTLRERQTLVIYGTGETLGVLDQNPVFDVLAPETVDRRAIEIGTVFHPCEGLDAELFVVPGKVPLYLEGEHLDLARDTDTNVGVEICAGGARLAFVPGAASLTPELKQRLAGCDVIMFDGTLFTDDEMMRTGTGSKTGRRMGHMPIDGPDGSLAALADIPGRRIYLHINNTNPILVKGTPERLRVEAAGWEVAEDGLQVVL